MICIYTYHIYIYIYIIYIYIYIEREREGERYICIKPGLARAGLRGLPLHRPRDGVARLHGLDRGTNKKNTP